MIGDVAVSVASWNCLADCYAEGVSVAKTKNSATILSWSSRFAKICEILQTSNSDILCLQEVDHFEQDFKPFLTSLGYHPVYLQRRDRHDGVLIAFKTIRFEMVKHRFVQFDDLASAGSSQLSYSQRARLKKRNVAIILLLKPTVFSDADRRSSSQSFTVSTAHLYWNPNCPMIKVAQTIYLLELVTRMRDANGLLPSASILTGDLNSLPQSQVYERIQHGVPFPGRSQNAIRFAAEKASAALSSYTEKGNGVRFICDATLGRLARWLRLLGVDAALEDVVSQEKRSTYKDFSDLFEKARVENRIIVTTSTGMMKRAACPETFLIKTSKTQELEKSLAKLLNFYDVDLKQSNFLSICSKCGGHIEGCSQDNWRVKGQKFPLDRDIFVCATCHQVYWQSNSSTASSVRATSLAENLFSLVQEDRQRRCKASSGNTLEDGDVMFSNEGVTVAHNLITLGNCRDNELSCSAASSYLQSDSHTHGSWLRFASAFALAQGHEPEYTNVNGSFCGTLDYIFVGGACGVESVAMRDRISPEGMKRKKFPNREWPSDHMLVSANLVLKKIICGRHPFSRTLSL